MTIGEVREIYDAAVEGFNIHKLPLTPFGRGALVLDNESRIKMLVRLELEDYYNTPEGREELDRSPYAYLMTRDAVDLLLKDVHGWMEADIKKFIEGGSTE